MLADASSSASSPLHDALCDFLSAAIHLILYARRVYPRDIFERRRHLDVTVFRSRHKELNEHVALVVRGARGLLERGEADALVVAILGSRGEALERFRFELRLASDGRVVDVPALLAQLRGFLLKLHVCDSLLAPLPADQELSFTTELHTTSTRSAQPLPTPLRDEWAEADVGRELAAMADGSDPSCVPLKSLSLDGITMGLSVLAARQC